jgi:ABC-type microcin C transport system permease subunit YejB
MNMLDLFPILLIFLCVIVAVSVKRNKKELIKLGALGVAVASTDLIVMELPIPAYLMLVLLAVGIAGALYLATR